MIGIITVQLRTYEVWSEDSCNVLSLKEIPIIGDHVGCGSG